MQHTEKSQADCLQSEGGFGLMGDSGDDIEKARKVFSSGKYTCVLCSGDNIVCSTETGITPLIRWLNENLVFPGYSAADKIVGKAAAFLYVLLGIKEIFAPVMSTSAMKVFSHFGIKFSCISSVNAIINRTGSGSCPMDEAVKNLQIDLKNSPEEAFGILKEKCRYM